MPGNSLSGARSVRVRTEVGLGSYRQSSSSTGGEFQEYVVYTAGINPNSKDQKASKALIDFLAAERATPVMKAKGLERQAH